MFKMARYGFLFLSLLFTAQTWAAMGYCRSGKPVLGDYLQSEILSDADFKRAVACAVNRAGHDVIGGSSFRAIYGLRIDDSQLNTIQIITRHSKREPFFNAKNLMLIKFQGVYDKRLVTRVSCEAAVEYQTVPEKHVAITLTDCTANAFGASPEHPLGASAAYAIAK